MDTSGNPPILAMLDTTDVVQIAETRALDLSDERWVADAGSHAYASTASVYSFPMGIEGKGLIYNKTLIEKTLGEAFHPEEYNTLDKLTALFARLSEKGVTPMLISKEDWSLGSHYAGFLYESQSENIEDVDAFVDSLRAGKVSLIDNPRFNQLMDTFDLLAANNYYKKDPLSADYSLDPSFLTDGDVAFWFNGNWAWPNLDAFLTGLPDPPELGLMPLPLGNDENDFVNNYLIGTGSKQIIIDKVKATPEQQQMAKDFLNWLVYDEEGQAAMVTLAADGYRPFPTSRCSPPTRSVRASRPMWTKTAPFSARCCPATTGRMSALICRNTSTASITAPGWPRISKPTGNPRAPDPAACIRLKGKGGPDIEKKRPSLAISSCS